jgi:hypothetical protein
MSRVIYSHLQSESGFDLLTESGVALTSGIVGIAGDVEDHGGIVSTLLTESGFDLMTEAGDALTLARRNGGTAAGTGRLVLRGTCSASGGPAGTVAGTGSVVMTGTGVIVVQGGAPIIRPAKDKKTTITGHISAGPMNHGYIQGKGTVTLPGGKITAGPMNHGYASAKGHATLSGKATVGPWNHGYVKATGFDEDEMAIVLLLMLDDQ